MQSRSKEFEACALGMAKDVWHRFEKGQAPKTAEHPQFKAFDGIVGAFYYAAHHLCHGGISKFRLVQVGDKTNFKPINAHAAGALVAVRTEMWVKNRDAMKFFRRQGINRKQAPNEIMAMLCRTLCDLPPHPKQPARPIKMWDEDSGRTHLRKINLMGLCR